MMTDWITSEGNEEESSQRPLAESVARRNVEERDLWIRR